ncbi:SDR family oxidoreductase [Candidatus Magnetomoraceae bacterium gMMP-15]
MNLKNKVALVLGAVKGIGKGLGLALANEGVNLALTHFDWEESLDSMKQDFASTGAKHLITKINLLDTEKIPFLIEQVIERFGHLDILINNIERGGWPVVHGPYVQKQWNLEMETTLRAKWWVFDSALPHLKNSGDGVVINISSIAGITGRCGPAAYVFNDGYSAANRAISSFTETWARQGAPEVRVNELMLGFFDARHARNTRGWGLLNESQKESIINHTLLNRTGKIEDIIKAVLFILRDAPFMTGSVIRLDGGYPLGGEAMIPMPDGVL